jgi:ABC-2 type transport system ATP-binding protein
MRRIDNEECSDHIGADRRERRGQKHHHQRGPGPDRAGGRPLSISGSEELDSGAKEEIGVVFDGSNYPDIRSPRKISAVMKRIYRSWDEAAFFQLLKKLSLPPDKQIRQFSKGMKMKLAISAALSHHSRLLILDEATSGLEKIADYIVFIHAGRVVFSRPKDELTEQYGILKCSAAQFDALVAGREQVQKKYPKAMVVPAGSTRWTCA